MEVALQVLPPPAGRGRGGDEGTPPHGEGCVVVAGGGRAATQDRSGAAGAPGHAEVPVAEIYRLNDERLKHYDPGLKRQTPAFNAAQTALKGALDILFAQAERELAALSDKAREAKVLCSLVNHREGLCVFVDRPFVPLDNNTAERILREPVIGRLLSHGSDSVKGAEFTATLYSVVGTLSMNGIDALRWLEAWLTACADNGRQPPDDLSPWLPWSMSEERRLEFTAPG